MNTEIKATNPEHSSTDGNQPLGSLISPAAPFSAAAMAAFRGVLNPSAFSSQTRFAGNGRLFATSGSHRLTDDSGVDIILAGNQAVVRAANLIGNNVFNMQGTNSDYDVVLAGGVVRLTHRTNGGFLEITMGVSAQKIVFTNGFLNLTKVGTTLKIGSQTISATTASVSATGLNGTETSSGLFTGQNSTFFRGSLTTVTDGGGAQSYNAEDRKSVV